MSGGDARRTEMAAAAGAFGRWLLQERELRGLDRDEVARLSKLGPAIIGALESGDPDRMPPKAYVFGYLRAYAAVVGLAADDVVGPEEAVAARRRPVRPRVLIGAAVALAFAVLAGLVLFGGARQRAPLKLDRPRVMERAPYPADPARR